MELVNKLDKSSITYFIQVGVPLGHQRGMTQNRNFFFFSMNRLNAFIYRHFSD